ncbi:MAG: hypothetical protein RIQ60_1030 [Pseudomonadota bacterium]|jgi:WD40 repeat protein
MDRAGVTHDARVRVDPSLRLHGGLALALAVLLSACGGGASSGCESACGSGPAPGVAAGLPIGQLGGAAADLPMAARRRPHSYLRSGVIALAAAPDGSSVAVAHADGRLRLLDPGGQQELRLLQGVGGAAAAGLVYTSDARWLVAVGRDSVVQVWDLSSGALRLTLRGHAQALRAVAASADGRWLATGGEETRVLLWDARSGRLQRVLTGVGDFVNCLSLSTDGRWLASGDTAGRVLVWNLVSPQASPRALLAHADEVSAVVLTPDGRHLVSAGLDRQVLLWDLAGSATKPVASLAATSSGAPASALQAVYSLALDRSASRLAAGGADGRLHLWDLGSGAELQRFSASDSTLNVLAFSPDDRRLLVGDNQGRLLNWPVSP